MTIRVSWAGFCHGRLVAGPEAGPLRPPEAGRMSLRRNPNHGSGPMTVSQSASCPSIDVSCLPRCGGAGGSDRSLLRAPCICAPRIRGGGASCSRERERVARFSGRRVWTTGLCGLSGQSWFRVPATTIMTTLGPVTYKRARHGAHQTSLVPVDESLGLVNDYLTRPAARSDDDGLQHGTGSGGVLLRDRRHDAIGKHPAAARLQPA